MRGLASRLRLVAPSPTLVVKNEADRLKAAGVDVIDLGPGEPDFASPAGAKRAGIAAIEADFTHYTAPAGIMELRVALARYYAERAGCRIDALEVVTGPGGKALLFAAMLSLVNPGDEVVIVAPYWVSFPEQVKLAGGTPAFAAARAEDGFAIRAESIAAAITPATRAVIVNAPCNPSGAVLARREAEALVELAIDKDLWIIADETYELFVYDPADRVSLLEFRERLGERLIYVSSFSKTWAMTGWRVGHAIAAPAVARAMMTIQSHDTTQAASMAQRAAVAALADDAAPRAMLAEYRRRRDLVVERLAQIPGIACPAPRGAFYVFPHVGGVLAARGLADSVTLSRALLTEQAVATVPGEAFGVSGHIRLSYATSEAHLLEGLARLEQFARGAAPRPAPPSDSAGAAR